MTPRFSIGGQDRMSAGIAAACRSDAHPGSAENGTSRNDGVSAVSGDFVAGVCVQADTTIAMPSAGISTRAKVLDLVFGGAGCLVIEAGRYPKRRDCEMERARDSRI